MMDLNRLFPFLFLLTILTSITACSNSSPPALSAVELDNGSVETCYNVQVSYAGNNQLKNVCTTREFGGFNGLGVSRYMRLSLPVSATVSINVSRTSGLDPADPDLVLYRNGELVQRAETTEFNNEAMTVDLVADEYVILLNEFVYAVSENKATQIKQTNTFTQNRLLKPSLANINQTKADSSCDTANEVTVSGFALFERVRSEGTTSLVYTSSTLEPIQQALVEVICNNGVYSSTTSAADGSYSLALPVFQQSFVRVNAQMVKQGSPGWDFSVVDNTTTGQPLYVMDTQAFSASANQTNKDLLAVSGWDNNFSRYTAPRVAAPFAILDSVRKAKDKVLADVPGAVFPALKINWSVNNTTSPFGDLNNGAIESSFFDGEEIYLLGAEDNDTDEYDEHVIIHEWGHYFEENFSRSDSIGGAHTSGDILDIRVIFGESFGNALSAMVTDDPLYVDTNGRQQSRGFIINMENNNCLNAGWYSECSIQSILYDIYDSVDDGADVMSMGFLPIYNVLNGPQKNTPALTSVFSFINALKAQNPSAANAIDALTSAQSIDPILDIYGSAQFSNNPGATDQLPIYLPF